MGEVNKIKAVELFAFVKDLIAQGQKARIVVSGSSMWPFLRDGIDSVEMCQGNFDDISRGDIVLVQRREGTYVMHRVFRKHADCFYMVGDAQQWIEGPLYPDQLVAVIHAIYRKDNKILCSNFFLKSLSGLWLLLRPFRSIIFRGYRIFRKIMPKKAMSD